MNTGPCDYLQEGELWAVRLLHRCEFRGQSRQPQEHYRMHLHVLRCARELWGSHTIQTLVAQSTEEAELIAASYGCKEAVCLSNFMTEL